MLNTKLYKIGPIHIMHPSLQGQCTALHYIIHYFCLLGSVYLHSVFNYFD